MAGLGALDVLVSDPDIDEVLVNGDEVWIDRRGHLESIGRLTGTTVEQVIERILAPIGRAWTAPRRSSMPASPTAPASVRSSPPSPSTGRCSRSDDSPQPCVRSPTSPMRSVSRCSTTIVSGRCNVVVCGATSSGKTSLLASMVDSITDDERLIVLEDTTELPCRAHHVVRLEARPATAEGVAPVSLSDLVRTALRLRPDRLIVGEVRSNECLALVQAMNTGHDGSLSTCHANGPLDALLRLESLVLQAAPQWPLAAVRHQLARSIDVIIHVDRVAGNRRISAICEVVPPTPDRHLDPPAVRTLGALHDDRFTQVAPLVRSRR